MIKLPIVALYVLVFRTGVFVFSAQNLVCGFVGANHPSAKGASAGIGRLGAISGPLFGDLLIALIATGRAYPRGFSPSLGR